MGDEQLVLKIDGSSFSATLNFANGKLITFSIDYKRDDDNFTIKGADIVISIDGYQYIPEKKNLLERFNDTVMNKYKIAKISESEAKQLLLELLDYINSVTKGEVIGLIEKVKNAVRSESVKVEFSSENYIAKSALIEFEGTNRLRRGTLTLIISIAMLIGSEFLLPAAPLLLAMIVIIGVILGTVGLLNIREGFRILDDLGRDVGIGYIGTTLYLASLIIFLVAIRAIAEKVGIYSIYIAIPGGILAIIANILVGVGFYEVGKEYNESLIKMGGILTAIPIATFIGYILVYVGLGKIKRGKYNAKFNLKLLQHRFI